jgi:hypothetical protein
MTKSREETNSEILSSAKSADVILPETTSEISRRHSYSVHPIQCRCFSCRTLRFKPYNSILERQRKNELDWWQED